MSAPMTPSISTKAAIALATMLTVSTVVAQGTIVTPPNWPANTVATGYPWGAQADGFKPEGATQELSKNLSTYPYRFISMQTNDQGVVDAGVAINAFNELSATVASLKGWDSFEDTRDVRMGAVMTIFSAEIGEALVEPTEEKYQVLRKMNDLEHLKRWFNWLEQIKPALSDPAKAGAAVILEPNIWGTILQARFHFEEELCLESWCAGRPWSQVLDFNVPLRAALEQTNSPILGEVQQNPQLFPETVRGLARAMVLAVKRAAPNVTVFSHASTWAVYANGCAGKGTTEQLTSESLREFKSTKNMVHWTPEDIQISAMANVRFYRELFGWDWNDSTGVNDYNGGLNWPHGFAVEKYGYDAGMVEDPNNTNHYKAQHTGPMPGAGTKTFYWDQIQMEKWLSWARTLSQGSRLPLLAYAIPIGNGSLSNKSFAWQDTFVDWLFNSNNWGGTYNWTPGNWEKFKDAGFVGLWAGRGGWPMTGTHWGSRGSNQVATGCDIAINGTHVSCTDNVNADGDGGFFFRNFKEVDRSFPGVPVTFDEEEFLQFTGFCKGRSEATIKTTFVGIQATDENQNIKTGVFTSGAKTPKTTIDGATTTRGPNNSEAIANIPEYMKSNALWLFAQQGDKFLPIQGDLNSGTQINGGLVNDGNAAEIKDVLENQVSTIGLLLNVDFSTIEGWPYWASTPERRIASVFPIEYELYIYDHLGHYINSVNGYLSDVDVANFSKVDPEDGNLKLSLLLYFVPMDTKGRHIGSGVYTMRGFFKEQTKWLCQVLKSDPSAEGGCTVDGQKNPVPGSCPMAGDGTVEALRTVCPGYILEKYGVDPNNPEQVATGNWETNVFQNSVVITEKFGYTRIRID